MLIKRLIDLFLDMMIFVLLCLVAPLIAVLLTIEGPVYAKAFGVLFILLILGSTALLIMKSRRKKLQELS